MSETQTAADGATAAPPGQDQDVEARARQMGWKPVDEFRGRRDQWLPADQFLERGFESPAVMAERLKVMTDKMAGMERNGQALSAKFDQAIETINTMTTMARSSERRAYERARADLERERERAVEAGDTQTFRRLDTEIQQLDKTAPVEPTRAAAPTAPVPVPGTPAAPDPAVLEFYRRNPWYGRDAAMTAEADLVHTGLINTRRDLTMEQNLAEVERRVRSQFPGTAAASPGARSDGAADNPRRAEPGAVSPASTGAGAPRNRNRRSFANMPQESQQAYHRYKAMLAGKGEPLTEAEWAADYWSQFEDEA